MASAKSSRMETRQELVESASDLLQNEGLDGFTLTKVAENVDVSKQMIYTIFGAKADLIRSVYDTKIERFAEELEEISGDDPVDTLLKYSLAYREWILENESLFDLMLSLSLNDELSDREYDVVRRNVLFEYYDEAVREAIDQGFIDEEVEVESLTDSFWAAANGCLRLEIIDYYPDEETAKQQYVDTTASVFWGRGSVLPDLEK
jgi:AcrR family transcriptional regulator